MKLKELFIAWLVVKALGERSSSSVQVPGESGNAELELGNVWPFTLSERIRRTTLDALHPDAEQRFRELMEHAKALGFRPRLADATRTPLEQREERWSKSSKADCSWHLGGRAVDLELHHGGLAWSEDYRVLAEWWKAKGGDWGGKFEGYGEHGDFRHFEYAPGMGNAKDHGLCDTDFTGIARYWREAKKAA